LGQPEARLAQVPQARAGRQGTVGHRTGERRPGQAQNDQHDHDCQQSHSDYPPTTDYPPTAFSLLSKRGWYMMPSGKTPLLCSSRRSAFTIVSRSIPRGRDAGLSVSLRLRRGFAYVIQRVARTVDRLDGGSAFVRTAKSAPAEVIVRVRRRFIGPRRCYTLPAMRHRRLIVLICGVVVLASVFPVGAQSGMWPVTDARGWFTISFPGDWEVVSRRAAVPDTPRAGAFENPLSMVSATAPRGRQHLPALSVMTIMLPDEFSGAAFSLLARFRRSQTQWLSESGYTIVKEGQARVAGHQAYYQYATFTIDSLRRPPTPDRPPRATRGKALPPPEPGPLP